MAQQQANASFLIDALYCEEESWEGVLRENCLGEEEESYDSDNIYAKSTILLEQDYLWDEEELSSLFSKEQQNDIFNKIENNPSLAGARRESVEWILKVVAHYSFSALSAVLAVDYFDRFLFSFQFQREKPWMNQLAAVACLSLAAKVEETQVPLLLDLQMEEARYVFEAKTIQRMEILVLSTLQWKMNPVTPLSYLNYMTRRLGLKNHLCWEFLKRCEGVLVSIISDCRYTRYLPSVMATATMLYVINGVEPCIGVEYKTQLLGILGIDEGKVEDCCKLMMELTSGSFGYQSNKRKFRSMPGSPKAVMEAYFSSDSSNDSWATAAPPSASSLPEPLSKKSRAQDQHLQSQNHSTADFLCIPR